MKRFVLQRDVDVSGVSGTGTVAEGLVFSDGTTVVRWIGGEHRSTVVWSSIESVIAIHGHNGATRLEWIDDDHAGWPNPFASAPQTTRWPADPQSTGQRVPARGLA